MSNKSNTIANLLPPELVLLSYTQITSLWSNYGHIYRLHVNPSSHQETSNDDERVPRTLILKSIHPPPLSASSDASESHLRKLLSYEVERYFYRHYADRLQHEANPKAILTDRVKVARAYPISEATQPDSVSTTRDSTIGNVWGNDLILEDLSSEFGFPANGSLGKEATMCVVKWLAGFHATFFGIHHRGLAGTQVPLVPSPNEWKEKFGGGGRGTEKKVEGVWRRGTYWYLDTRREEWGDVDPQEYAWLSPWVEKVNSLIDSEIQKYGTLLHGDVKGANIVFNRDPNPHRQNYRGKKQQQQQPYLTPTLSADMPLECALYDFQYVGLSLGVHDLVYFLGTSVESSLLRRTSGDPETELLREYYLHFSQCLDRQQQADDDESETRLVDRDKRNKTRISYSFDTFLEHWDLAIVDWYRFMVGWGFWGNDQWVERRAKEIVMKWTMSPPTWAG